MIRLDRVERRFGSRVLFEGLTWQIDRGARIGLVGPNGAGKTTILRMLAAIDLPDAGGIERAGTVRVGYLPQEVEGFGQGSVLSVVLSGFPEVSELEDRLEALEREMAGLEPGHPRTDELAGRYGELRHRFETMEGDRLEARARAILSGLGVDTDRHHASMATLSGGWRMRAALARLLLGEPDLLLLDEPTNHLDLEAIDWLERFLGDYAGAFVVVSHDRYFLNRMVREIVELERGRLSVWPGNYEEYLDRRAEREAALEKAARHQERERARVERFIERFRYKNTKARQVQSRIRSLEKMERIETEARSKRIRFGFPPAARSGDVVLRAEGLTKRFGAHTVYDRADLVVRRADRIALVGPNGAGKSTLLKLAAGRLAPDGGTLELGYQVHLHYYAQHQLDALDPSATVLEEVEKVAQPGDRPRLRKLLGCFLFTGEDVDKRVAVLSGGEKARLALARMLIRPANLLLLDEPTNHLDLRSREVLEDALNEFDGTLMLVSHDRYFINRVATSIGEVGEGRVRLYEGDYDTWQAWRAGRVEPPGEAVASAADDGADDDAGSARRRRQEEKRREAEERNKRYRERKRVEDALRPLERSVEQLEARLRDLERERADPAVYADPERAREVGREYGEAERRLAELYARWEALAAELEGEV